MNQQVLGVVVCGGQSKRMGRDKGLIEQGGKAWAQLAVEKLEALSIPVVLSINQTQEEAYKTKFASKALVADHQNIGGPMNGLLSVHATYPEHDLLLLACDMIDMQQEVLTHLLQVYSENIGFEYYAYEVDGVIQPFCAIYTSKALKSLMQKHLQETLGSSSPRYNLENGHTYKIATDISEPFTNYNTLDERND